MAKSAPQKTVSKLRSSAKKVATKRAPVKTSSKKDAWDEFSKNVEPANGYLLKEVEGVKTLFLTKPKDALVLKELQAIIGDRRFYAETVELTADFMKPHMSTIESEISYNPYIYPELIKFVEQMKDTILKVNMDEYNAILEDGKIDYNDLDVYFKPKMMVYTNDGYQDIAFRIKSVSYNHYTPFYFLIAGEYLAVAKDNLVKTPYNAMIYKYAGCKKLSDLNVKIISDDMKESLAERGGKVKKYLGMHYIQYDGMYMIDGPYGPVTKKLNGRIMLDDESYSNNQGIYNDGEYENEFDEFDEFIDVSTEGKSVDYLINPYLKGYSFGHRIFARFLVTNMSDIVFREEAFDLLVLDDKKKKLIKSMVNNIKAGFADIVDDKSGGCVFLLRGSPGTGKTLTCEAVAESLHQPLYVVSAGELGTDVVSTNKNMTAILDRANKWNAVLLVDEADVFMEERVKGDIKRNAVVGVFLRLLEKLSGVMFLTTNRSDSFDQAFISRISVTLDYPDLSDETRKHIWKNLLTHCKIPMIDRHLSLLSTCKINGRQVKNTIRLAQCLCVDDKKDVTFDVLVDVVSINHNDDENVQALLKDKDSFKSSPGEKSVTYVHTEKVELKKSDKLDKKEVKEEVPTKKLKRSVTVVEPGVDDKPAKKSGSNTKKL